MINLKSGAIDFDDGMRIGRQTSMKSVALLSNTKTHPLFVGRTLMSIGQHSSGAVSWGVGLVFIQNALKQVWLQNLVEITDPTKSDWTLANEKGRKAVHDRFLEDLCEGSSQRKQVGHSIEYNFSWGKVSSNLDLKGVQALIVVEYC